MASTSYIEKTRGAITASKLKDYMIHPYLYKLKYIDEINLEEEDQQWVVVGNWFHEIMEKGKDFFLEKYHITDKFLKKDLVEKILERFKEEGLDKVDIEAHKKRLSKTTITLDMLREERYGTTERAKFQKKIVLTGTEGELILGMYQSAIQQPILDCGNKQYINEHRFECDYKGHKLSAQLDRVSFKLWEKFLKLEEIEKNSDLEIVIRDWKTTGDISKILKNFTEYGQDDYGYAISMAFYFTIMYVLYGAEAGVFLDFIEKKSPFITETISISRQNLAQKLSDIIIPYLDRLIDDIDNNTFRLPTREEIMNNKELMKYYAYIPVYQEEATVIDYI